MAGIPAKIILGSASPRRALLLSQMGLSFDIRSAAIDESPKVGEEPMLYVQRMAREKSLALALEEQELLITADTTVISDGQSLGKPANRDQAKRMLLALAGKNHEVATAVYCRCAEEWRACTVRTAVEFMDLSEALVEAYLDSEEPWDKAGSYALQGLAGSFIRSVEGSVSNVIGLPQVETREMLAALGVSTTIGCA
ncbi:MAG: Maf family protein [Pseudomonadota bacterium]